ncbi:MAG: hypothetical protein Q6J33_05675 [Gloeomargarita sp. DG_2_bins_126]
MLQIKSGNLLSRWFSLVLVLLLFLLSVGGQHGNSYTVHCTKPEPSHANCQIIQSYFWGLFRNVSVVNNVVQAIVKEETRRNRDEKTYSIYKVFLVTRTNQEVDLTDWETSHFNTHRLQNSLEAFLQSDLQKDYFSSNRWQSYWLSLLVILPVSIYILFLLASPYRVRVILDRTGNSALLIANFFPFGTALNQVVDLNCIYLKFQQTKDSDGSDYYQIKLILNIPKKSIIDFRKYGLPIGGGSYEPIFLQQSYNQTAIQNYWQTAPVIQLLKQFVRAEVVTTS